MIHLIFRDFILGPAVADKLIKEKQKCVLELEEKFKDILRASHAHVRIVISTNVFFMESFKITYSDIAV